MKSNKEKIRVLIFIGSLRSGGKERRLIELLGYLRERSDIDFRVVLTIDEIHYPAFYDLNIAYEVIKKDAAFTAAMVFIQFYKICRRFKPNIIHTWGRVQSFYSLPAVILLNIPLINSQITSAPPPVAKNLIGTIIDHINFSFSKMILSNSKAGINAYNPPLRKRKIIYNGINLNRFHNLPDRAQIKQKYELQTPYTVVMSASFSPNKDYELFYKVAKKVTSLRKDITFIGVGVSHDDAKFKRLLNLVNNNKRILFPGRIDDVEALVNACDIGILFSNKKIHGEGISNSIMEYMALSKPVIANDAGGTREILHHNKNGFLIANQTVDEIASLILDLIDDKSKAKEFGDASRSIIEDQFSIEVMGRSFEQVYLEAVNKKLESATLMS